MAHNQLHGLAPEEEEKRWRLAMTNIAFCEAMGRVLHPEQKNAIPTELNEVWRAAVSVLRDAAANL